MKQKITLTIDEDLIKSAKQIATEQGVSLSLLVENYLRLLIKEKRIENKDLSPRVKSLIGVVKLPPDFDVREEYTNYLMEKYK